MRAAMSEQDNSKKDEILDEEAARRRAFLRKAGTAAVAAPAVGILLSATAKQASAQVYGTGDEAQPDDISDG